jgi:small subunit ribosomal protein S21
MFSRARACSWQRGIDSRLAFCYRQPHKSRSTGAAALPPAHVFLLLRGRRVLVQIFVRDNNVDQALKALKKKMQREGTFREMKRRNHYEKPSEKRAREKAEAVRRARKLGRKRAQREGLLPRK